MVKTGTITITSSNEVPEFIDITDRVGQEVEKSGAKDGNVLVYAQHTTASIILQEPEENLTKDLQNLLRNIAPRGNEYHHTAAPDHVEDRQPNGHSHCQHLFMGSSETIPFVDGNLMLGTFQRIFLVELDRARTRNIIVQVVGE